MEKFKIFVILIICFTNGFCEKICVVENHELKVPDDVDCNIFTEKSGVSGNSLNDRSAKPYFWPGFPFPPGMNFPNWNNMFPPNWIGRPQQRPRPRPPPSNIETCPDEGIKFISHPEDCEKYILCVDGVEISTLNCPNNLHFSRELRSCTNARDAGCEDFEWVCPDEDDADNIVFLPNKEDCTMYYLCWGGTPIPMNCAPGLHWSIDENMCMNPDDAECEFGEPFECPDTGIHNLPHPDNCEEYFLCVNGNEILRECPSGLHFSPTLKICTSPETAGCDEWKCPQDSDEISFIPNTEDCRRYYICVGGNQIERECAAGLHWSISKNMCMNPEDANCPFGEEFECPEDGIHSLPHPDNCEEYFLCVNGNEILRTCPSGLHFSPHLEICTSPETAGCDGWKCPQDSDEISFIPNTEDCRRYYICVGGNQIERECAAGLHWSISKNMCMNPEDANCPFGEEFECPEDGIHSLPHPDNCEEYFLCVNGNEILRTCPSGLHFSPHLEICTSPETAGCNGWKCPQDSDEISFIPNTEDCRRYYICVGGNQIERECAAGLHWSISQNMCMNPRDANCPFGEEFSCPETGIHSLPNPDSCEEFFLCVNGNELLRTCPSGLHFSPHFGICTQPEIAGCDGWECPEGGTEITFIPNPEDCEAYFICFFGSKLPMTCNNGQHWSITESICMNEDDANCPFDEDNEEAKGFNGSGCPSTGIASIPNPESCEEYYLCVNGNKLPRTCPNSLHFSRTSLTCVHPDEAECTLEGCPPNDLGFLPHEDDCEKYYLCFWGTKHPMRCPGDLHWSVKQNSCMEPDEAGCKNDEIITECPETGIEQIPYPDDCELYILCVHGLEVGPLSCAPGLHFSPTERTCMSPEKAQCDDDHHIWTCPETDEPGVIVFIPNVEDCSSYYLCWQGRQIPLTCAVGHHWSIQHNRCMHPDLAECPWAEDDEDIETCPDEGIKAISHPESCELYYLCVNGHKVERTCPPGMHFSREIRNCAHPIVANCQRDASFTSFGAVSETNTDSCSLMNSTQSMAFIQNIKDCQSYYLCLENESVLFKCADGLEWNAEQRKCMNKTKSNCQIHTD